MRRGVSPVITSTLLVLVSIVIVSIFYTWATASTSQVSGALYSDADAARKRILSSVEILTPPPLNPADQNQPVFIHNNGKMPLTHVKVYITPPGSTTLTTPQGILIDSDGNMKNITQTDWPISALYPGEAIVVWIEGSDYSGYTITVLSDGYETSKTIGVST